MDYAEAQAHVTCRINFRSILFAYCYLHTLICIWHNGGRGREGDGKHGAGGGCDYDKNLFFHIETKIHEQNLY